MNMLFFSTEEVLRSLQEYFDAHPPVSISQALDELEAANRAAVISLAAEWGLEPPPPLPPRRQFLADRAKQRASAAVSHPRHSTVPREPRQRFQSFGLQFSLIITPMCVLIIGINLI